MGTCSVDRLLYYMIILFVERYGDHRDLHVLTHSFPTRRSSDLTQRLFVDVYRSTRLFGREGAVGAADVGDLPVLSRVDGDVVGDRVAQDRKSTRLNSSH